MGSKPGKDRRAITRGTPQKPNMFSISGKWYLLVINFNGVRGTCILYREVHLLCCRCLEFGFVGTKFNLILPTEDLGEFKKIEELLDIITDQGGVICLADARHSGMTKEDSQGRSLGHGELLLSKYFVEVRGVGSSLLQALLVVDGTHELSIPVNKSFPTIKSVVEIQIINKFFMMKKIKKITVSLRHLG